MSQPEKLRKYWRTNVRYVLILLSIWVVSSLGLGVLFADALNSFKIAGFKMGFWMAQQGSIYIFVVLIFIYTYLMNRLDRKFHVDEL